MIQFQGFKPSGIEKIANAMGFQGEEKDFQKFLEENPDRQAEMMRYQDMARKMVQGGLAKKMQVGGTISTVATKRVTDPKLPTGAVINPKGVPTDDVGQTIDTTSGQVGTTPMAGGVGATTTTATATPQTPVATMTADTKEQEVKATTDAITASQVKPTDPRAKVTAAEATKSSVSDLDAAQGTAIKLENPMQREVQQGELVDGVANAEKASKFNEQIQAATATPSEKDRKSVV